MSEYFKLSNRHNETWAVFQYSEQGGWDIRFRDGQELSGVPAEEFVRLLLEDQDGFETASEKEWSEIGL